MTDQQSQERINQAADQFTDALVQSYKVVAERVRYWNKDNNCGLVVGATHLDQLREIRELAGDMPLLIPGVGAQGGSLDESIIAGTDNFRKLAVDSQ